MTVKLAYVISFVEDIEGAVAFYRDAFGFTPRSVSPGWVELDTGTTTLALHAADARNPSGTTKLSFAAPDVPDLHRKLVASGVTFTREPAVQHGRQIAELVGPGGSGIGLSGPATVEAKASHGGGDHPGLVEHESK